MDELPAGFLHPHVETAFQRLKLPVLGLAVVFLHFKGVVAESTTVAVSLFVSAMLTIVLHRLLEKPVLAWLRRVDVGSLSTGRTSGPAAPRITGAGDAKSRHALFGVGAGNEIGVGKASPGATNTLSSRGSLRGAAARRSAGRFDLLNS